MKKTYIILAALLAAAQFSHAQSYWSPSGSNIYNNNGGFVGIGTTNPQGALHVKGPSGWGTIKLLPLSDNVEAGISISSKSSETDFSQSWLLATFAWGLGTNFTIGNSTIGPALTIVNNSGNVGIGSTSPTARLSVSGGSGNIVQAVGNYAGNSGISVRNLDANGGSQVNFVNNSGSVKGAITLVNNQETNGHGTLLFWDGVVNLLNFKNGYVGVGTTSPDQALTVNGTVHATAVKVDLSVPFPDYLFRPGYSLPKLAQVQAYIEQNHHLPDMPSALEVAKAGLDLGEMNALLAKKVEELTLYLIQQQKKINALEKKVKKSVSKDSK